MVAAPKCKVCGSPHFGSVHVWTGPAPKVAKAKRTLPDFTAPAKVKATSSIKPLVVGDVGGHIGTPGISAPKPKKPAKPRKPRAQASVVRGSEIAAPRDAFKAKIIITGGPVTVEGSQRIEVMGGPKRDRAAYMRDYRAGMGKAK